MRFDAVAEALDGVPVMPPDMGRRVYDHLREQGARDILELGTAHGKSAAFMAAAIEENGGGKITTVDWYQAEYDPTPEQVLERASMSDRVELVRVRDSSYTWLLKELVERQSDSAGNCEPIYDFCYIDGAHNFTIDGLAVVLVEKLLRPGGWLLLDDLSWNYAEWTGVEGEERIYPRIMYPMSASERMEPHMRSVFELIVKQHPSFAEFIDQDGEWGWARKAPDAPRRYTLEMEQTLGGMLTKRLKLLRQRMVARAAQRREQ